MISNKKILLTGSTGLVGKNIIKKALKSGINLIAPDRKELDLLIEQDVALFIKKSQPDLIIHAAGKVGGIQANMSCPVDFLIENTTISSNIIKGGFKAGVNQLINISSTSVYPSDSLSPLKEEYIFSGKLHPANEGYALAKLWSLQLCKFVNAQFKNHKYITLIPCNLYGPFDSFSEEKAHLVPSIIRKIHQAKIFNKKNIEIWGDGTARREFMFVEDLADAIIKAINDINDLPDLMNLGMGYDFSINEYYHKIAECMSWKGGFVHNLSKPVGQKKKLADLSRQKSWGWVPKHTIDQGVYKTYNYFKSIID